MTNNPKDRGDGYICPVVGCKKRRTTLYNIGGLMQHLVCYHKGHLINKLNIKQGIRVGGKIQVSTTRKPG